MLIDTFELTGSHVDLGELSEVPAMILYATALCHRMTKGLSHSVRGIVDRDGRELYPSYYWTHLRVPPSHRLNRYKIWDRVAVGVDVASFGGTIVDAEYALGAPELIQPDRSTWSPERIPVLRSGTMFTVDKEQGDPQPSVPRAGLVAEMQKLTTPPSSVKGFARIQAEGLPVPPAESDLNASDIRYSLALGREIMPGHAAMFSTFINVVDRAEQELLASASNPPFLDALKARVSTLERETHFLQNSCRSYHTLTTNVSLQFLTCEPDLTKTPGEVAVALLEFTAEVYEKQRAALMITSRSRKVVIVSSGEQSLRRECERFVSRHSARRTAHRPIA